MLPRTCRSLVTGYTTFTTDLLYGSYLTDRRATQEQRVFKYGARGYGIRFLPSYCTSSFDSLFEDHINTVTWYVNYDRRVSGQIPKVSQSFRSGFASNAFRRDRWQNLPQLWNSVLQACHFVGFRSSRKSESP